MTLTYITLKRALLGTCLAVAFATLALAQGNGRGPGPNVPATVVPLPESQAKVIQFMREEEKLARDVYQQLYEKWQISVFKNIAASEEQHFRATGSLLTRYNLSDPAESKSAGTYSDSGLTMLYQELMAKGLRSLKDALEVGVLIEETDIADLEKAIATTDRADIKRVFTNLMNASYSHKEAFETNLELACAVAP
jgi:hypothetical protein